MRLGHAAIIARVQYARASPAESIAIQKIGELANRKKFCAIIGSIVRPLSRITAATAALVPPAAKAVSATRATATICAASWSLSSFAGNEAASSLIRRSNMALWTASRRSASTPIDCMIFDPMKLARALRAKPPALAESWDIFCANPFIFYGTPDVEHWLCAKQRCDSVKLLEGVTDACR